MTLASAWVTLKQHRFEVLIGALVAVAFAIWAATVEVRTATTSVPRGCFQIWNSLGPDGAGACLDPIRAWASALISDGDVIIHAMAYLPLGIGLLVGVPIVAGELEGRTAQTAWSLFGSRSRWLGFQVVPVLVVVSLAMVLLAIATAAVESDRVIFGYSPVEELGHYGWELVPQWLAALGVGLLAGALFRRPLPAFALGLLAVIGLVWAIGMAHQAWLEGLTPTPIASDASGPSNGAIITAVAWRSPAGQLLARTDADALAHASGAPQPGSDDPQDNPAITWLQDHGYTEVDLGVSRSTALTWGYYEGLLFATAGGTAAMTAFMVTKRVRPT
jgi:hypothetical protein